MNKEIISIIIPIYNSAQTIENCLNSIVNQTYKNLEVILIDDGSDDNSALICRQWVKKDKRIRFFQQKHAGVSAARNKGLNYMTGEYFAFIDIDDYIDETIYEKLLIKAKEDGSDMVFCLFDRWNISGEIISKKEDACLDDLIKNKEYKYFFIDGEKSSWGVIWRSLYKADKLKDIRFNETLRICEDLEYLIRCLNHIEKASLICEKLYHHVREDKTEDKIKYNYQSWFLQSQKQVGELLYEVLKDSGKINLAEAQLFWRYCCVVVPYCYTKDLKIREIKRFVKNSFLADFNKKKYYIAYIRNISRELPITQRVAIRFLYLKQYRIIRSCFYLRRKMVKISEEKNLKLL